jgi:hypothetical protein
MYGLFSSDLRNRKEEIIPGSHRSKTRFFPRKQLQLDQSWKIHIRSAIIHRLLERGQSKIKVKTPAGDRSNGVPLSGIW